MSTSTQSRVTRLFHKVLLRHADTVACPEGQLMAAVITKAFQDALGGNRDARRFFRDGRLHLFAGLIGADADAVRDMALRGRRWRPDRAPITALAA
jgi:hypothetical protein